MSEHSEGRGALRRRLAADSCGATYVEYLVLLALLALATILAVRELSSALRSTGDEAGAAVAALREFHPDAAEPGIQVRAGMPSQRGLNGPPGHPTPSGFDAISQWNDLDNAQRGAVLGGALGFGVGAVLAVPEAALSAGLSVPLTPVQVGLFTLGGAALGGIAGAAADWVDDRIQQSTEYLGERAGAGVDWVEEHGGAALGWLGERAGAGVDWVEERATSAVDWIKDRFGNDDGEGDDDQEQQTSAEEEKPKSGETEDTQLGKKIHKERADARRTSGEWDDVNQAIKTKDGQEIQVPKRVNPKTGEATDGRTQTAQPDAVSYKRGEILDDKPAGTDVLKNSDLRQQIRRFIDAYTKREGEAPKRIIIDYYDKVTGGPAGQQSYTPDQFLPPGG